MAKKPIGAPRVQPGARHDFFMLMQDTVWLAGDWTLQEIAEAVGVSRQTVHKALRGPMPPGRDLVVRIAEVLVREMDESDRAARKLAIGDSYRAAVAEHRSVPQSRSTADRVLSPTEVVNSSSSEGPRFEIVDPARRRYGEAEGIAPFWRRFDKLWEDAGEPSVASVATAINVQPTTLAGWRNHKAIPRSAESYIALVAHLQARNGILPLTSSQIELETRLLRTTQRAVSWHRVMNSARERTARSLESREIFGPQLGKEAEPRP